MRANEEFSLLVEVSVIYLISPVLHKGIILATQPVVAMAEMLMKDWVHQHQQFIQRNCTAVELLRPQSNPRLQPLFEAAQVQCAIRSVQTIAFNQVCIVRTHSGPKTLISNSDTPARVVVRRLSTLRSFFLRVEPRFVGVGSLVAAGNSDGEFEGASLARANADTDTHSRRQTTRHQA